MRKATLIVTALIAVLALSVGAFAYPVVVGTHSVPSVHATSPATVTHPTNGDDNSTANETNTNETADHHAAANETENDTAENETSDHQVAPFGNETENDTEAQDNETAPVSPSPLDNDTEMGMFNISVEHNVTVAHSDNTTWVNGTITVDNGTTTLLTVTFQIVSQDNGTANVTINATGMSGSESIAVHGFAFYSPEHDAVYVFGVAKATQNGTFVWERMFAFEAPSDCHYGS